MKIFIAEGGMITPPFPGIDEASALDIGRMQGEDVGDLHLGLVGREPGSYTADQHHAGDSLGAADRHFRGDPAAESTTHDDRILQTQLLEQVKIEKGKIVRPPEVRGAARYGQIRDAKGPEAARVRQDHPEKADNGRCLRQDEETRPAYRIQCR